MKGGVIIRIIGIDPQLLDEGQGAKANRLIPNKGSHLDPFVLFDEYQISPGASFPEHPHGGFEGFQVLMEGRTIYRDILGHRGEIDPGDVRRFVAGDGFRHSEEPDYDGTVRGYLLWIKIPESNKGTPIIFEEVGVDDIPQRRKNGCRISTIMGEGSPVVAMADVLWEILSSDDGGTYTLEMKEDHNGFIYVSRGSARVDDLSTGPGKGAILQGEGEINVSVGKGTEMVHISGRKLNESIVQDGHFVL